MPCPACGLTSGVVHLLHGRWNAAFEAHWLSPFLLAGIAVAGLLAMMPTAIHRRLINQIEVLERSTGLSKWLGVCIGVSWIWRIIGGS